MTSEFDSPAPSGAVMPGSSEPTPLSVPTPPPAQQSVGRAPHPASSNPLPRILAVANQKGGVGKTTTTINLAACLADIGYRVLVVDLDPQANATTGLGIDPRSISSSMYDVMLHDVPLRDCALATEMPGLMVAPSSQDLAGAEIELVSLVARESRLDRALQSYLDDSRQAGDPIDYVFIDCPPSLGLLTVNAMVAGREVLIPISAPKPNSPPS